VAHEQSSRERARALVKVLVPAWHPTPRQVLWAIRIAIVLGLLFAIGYAYGITLWDWASLLIVPAVIAAGGVWFNQQQRERELEVENQHTQGEALQAYLDQIGKLLVDEELRTSEETSDVRKLARARTLTVLDMLSPERKPRVLEFLFEMGLIQTDPPDREEPIISLRFAILCEAPLENRHLLKSADLDRATLDRADLTNANLNSANLTKARLIGSNLTKASLIGSKLTKARLLEADVTEANLSRADLTGAMGITSEELHQRAKSLEGATMPNGQKYEDWLKDKEARK
jgi:hypothetical protein